MEQYSLLYDRVHSGIRVVKLSIVKYKMSVTRNSRLDTLNVEFDQPDFFSPKLSYIDGKFIMTYDYVVIPQGWEDEFRNAYDDCMQFCKNMKPVIDDIIQKIKRGEQL